MKVSVVIPCRNGGAFLAPAIDSVLNQTRPPDEVIVVDDGSTDDSFAVAGSYGGIVRPVRGPGKGAPAARNHGMGRARGDAVMFLDADDLLGRTAMENLVSVLQRHPKAIACCPWYRLEEERGSWHSAPASCAPRRAGYDDLAAWLTGWYQPPCSVLWSRGAYERTGGWDPKAKVNNDGDIMMRGFVAGNRLVFASQGCAYYRRPPEGQFSLSGTRNTEAGVEARIFILDRIARSLRDRGRLLRYRGPLSEAFLALAEDCRETQPELHDRCLLRAREYGGPRMLREIRWLGARAARKTGYLREMLASATRRPATDISGEAAPASRPMTDDDESRLASMRKDASRHDRDEPKVSVVIPTYNRAPLLRRALDSALAQSYRNMEILVVDDASTDETESVVAAYDDSRVRYLCQETNRGVSAARNRGMQEAQGEYIAFLDSDDEWLPGKLACQVDAFSAHGREVGLVYTGCETVDSRGNTRVDIPLYRGNLHSKMLLRNMLIGGGSGVMIRRSVVATVGGFDESLPAIEDYDYWLRISRFYSFEYVPLPLTRYHDPIAAEHGRESRRSRDFMANFDARDVFYLRNRHEMERAGIEHRFLLESARRHLRWPYGSLSSGRRLLLQALRKRPFSHELYPWVVYAYLPGGMNKYAISCLRRLQGMPAALRGERQPD